MEINFTKYYSIRNANTSQIAGSRLEVFLKKLNSSGSYTQIGDEITLNDGTSINVNEIPKINVRLLQRAFAKNNLMDFGNGCYFKFTNSFGEERAIFSMPGGALCRPASEYIAGCGEYDLETERYMNFWNGLGSGHALMAAPGNANFPSMGYSCDDIRGYLDEGGISKGFFSVKIGSRKSDFYYSNSKQYPIYTKDEYDLRYHTMTSPDFSYGKSVFRDLEPGTEITIANEKYTLKDDFTLDIPYGIDIYDIQLPKYTHVSKVPSGIDCRA